MSTDYCEINYDGTIDDFDEEIVNSAIIYFVQNTYQELKTIIPVAYEKKNYKEIKARLHKFKTTSRYIGAVNFSVLCNKIQQCCEEGKSIKVPDPLYFVSRNNNFTREALKSKIINKKL